MATVTAERCPKCMRVLEFLDTLGGSVPGDTCECNCGALLTFDLTGHVSRPRNAWVPTWLEHLRKPLVRAGLPVNAQELAGFTAVELRKRLGIGPNRLLDIQGGLAREGLKLAGSP